MAQAAEVSTAGRDLGFEHSRHAITQCQIGMPDDAGADARRPVLPAVAHRADAGAALDLADRLHLQKALGAVHRAAFVENRGDDVVAGVDVGKELVEQMAIAWEVPDDDAYRPPADRARGSAPARLWRARPGQA